MPRKLPNELHMEILKNLPFCKTKNVVRASSKLSEQLCTLGFVQKGILYVSIF